MNTTPSTKHGYRLLHLLLGILLIGTLCLSGNTFAQEYDSIHKDTEEDEEQIVTVSNVTVEQFGAFLRVTYDLETSDGEATHIFASFSEDAGETYTTALRSASGDINKEVAPGVGRWFAWNFH